MKVKRETVDKTNDLIKHFQEKEKSWGIVKGQDEIIFGTGQSSLNQDPKHLKSLVKEIIEDLKINYPIIVVQERQEEYLWGFYYNPKNWDNFEKVSAADGSKEYNTIIKFAIPMQTTKKEQRIRNLCDGDSY